MELNTKFVVDDLDDKIRLDVFLTESTGWSRSQIKNQVDAGKVLVNGKKQKAGFLIKNGDEIDVKFSKEQMSAEPENISLNIVFEDDDIAIINKPQGMVVHPAPGSPNHTLVNALLFHFENLSSGSGDVRPGIVHRIDKDTSGLLVVAKNDKAHESLAKQIAEHSCFRHYLALVEGNVKNDSGIIDTFIGRSEKDRKVMAVKNEGKRAISRYYVTHRFGNYTLLEFVLETGRTHQIRVHSKYIGHPIVGDKTYGIAKQKFNLNGQLLHAFKLELTHPTTGKRMTFECELPDYFQKVLDKLN
ncbi:MAG: RluA family pseudouridine synthase [Clostridia bacterium]|nr:RluA family pseudouridine synthase [Clostridia bacterium]